MADLPPRLQWSVEKMSSMDFYAYLLMIRDGASSDHVHLARDLFHQFLVDVFVKIESERLPFIISYQKELRVDDYAHLHDALNNDARHGHEVGRLLIPPATFTDGPRYMHEKTQDAMTYTSATTVDHTPWPRLPVTPSGRRSVQNSLQGSRPTIGTTSSPASSGKSWLSSWVS